MESIIRQPVKWICHPITPLLTNKFYACRMKKVLTFSLLSLLLATLKAQESQAPYNLFPISSPGIYNGFVTIISGQKLDYPPTLEKGKL